MKKTTIICLVIALATLLSAGTVKALQILGADVAKVGELETGSLKVGQQGVGGVTFFNGTIINETTTNGVGNPVTFGDDVRIDGRVWRGKTAGASDGEPFVINDDLQVAGDIKWNNVNSLQDYITYLWNTTNDLKNTTNDLKYRDDSDTLGNLLFCQENQVPKWNGWRWNCADDVDTDTDTLGNISCSYGQIPQKSVVGWGCVDNQSSDIRSFIDCLDGKIRIYGSIRKEDWSSCKSSWL